MIRIVFENLLLFLMPSALYFGWVYLTRKAGKSGPTFSDAPLTLLCAAGAALVIITLVVFEDDKEGGRPGQTYQPPEMRKDGTISPGRIK
jgi:hypothetical protein